jgi:micrococcal nuclease
MGIPSWSNGRGEEYAVRYISIDTPERGERLYEEATEKNRELVEGKIVRLEKDVSETDIYGRLLRYVYVDDTFVNAELVRLGYAKAIPYPPDTKFQELFAELEQEAKDAGRGIWACTSAIEDITLG